MPIQLLPASAAAFAPRSAPTIVLGSRVETWLTQALKRISRVKRPLNSVSQHYRFLTETLGASTAIWLLSSLMLPNAPDSELLKDSDPLREAISNYTLTPVQAYVVHVDMVSQHEVAFKLTQDTIDALIDYHNDIYSVDIAASTYAWPEKDDQIKNMQETFVQAVNRFVYRTGVRALEGLEEEGAGELLEGRSDGVKSAIMNLFLPLLPPPPRVVDLIAPAPSMSNMYFVPGQWWQPAQAYHLVPNSVDPWQVLASNSGTSTAGASPAQYWSSLGMDAAQLPSPTPSYSHSPVHVCEPPFYTSAQLASGIPIMSMPMIPLPSALPSCGTSMSNTGFDVHGWGFNAFAPQYATI
ncbi:hypothetical protein E4T43_04287 [Aureobasidium subglaciale]|nr:hypothetical protein E4T43_04287 [Aureobasidium subglaciale]